MDILYLSSLCSLKEYERMFRKFGSTSSHASQKFNRMMVEGLVKNGCNVDALTQRILPIVDEEEFVRPDETEEGIKYSYLPAIKGKLKNRIAIMLNAFWAICKWHRMHPEGIVICDIILGELSLALWAASLIHRIKTTAIVTDVPSIRAGENRTGIKAIPYKIKNAAIGTYKSYIFLTEQMNHVLNPTGKPYVIIEGIVDKHVLDEPNLMEQKYPEKVCMMAGLLEDIFGVDDLLKAFHDMDCPEARLVFYGKGSSVQKIIEAGRIDSRISYCGELTNQQIVQEEKKATLLINPRPPVGEWTAFSFPSKNMEYIASGTPMLAYKLPCIPVEYLQHFFYPANTDFACVLEEAIKLDRSELHKMGIEAQRWIVQNKNSEIQTKKAVEMFNRLKRK